MREFRASHYLALLQNPTQLEILRKDPSVISSAVEELNRFDSAVQFVSRVTQEDVIWDQKLLPGGSRVLLLLGAANRNPEVFVNPDSLDVTRQNNRHLAFGQGIHFCLGAALARLEGQIIFQTLVTQIPHARLASPHLSWRVNSGFRGLESLPVVVSPIGKI